MTKALKDTMSLVSHKQTKIECIQAVAQLAQRSLLTPEVLRFNVSHWQNVYSDHILL